jgi:hypothetical protein
VRGIVAAPGEREAVGKVAAEDMCTVGEGVGVTVGFAPAAGLGAGTVMGWAIGTS